MKEIRRRSTYIETEGIACGPASTASIEAEIEIEDNGKHVFLHAQWVDVVDELVLETSAESLYDIYVKMKDAEGKEFDRLVAERDRIQETEITDDECYKSFYDELRKMVAAEMEHNGIEVPEERQEGYDPGVEFYVP